MFQFIYFLLLDIFKHLYHNSIQAFPTDKRVRKKEYYFAVFAESKILYTTVTVDDFESHLAKPLHIKINDFEFILFE